MSRPLGLLFGLPHDLGPEVGRGHGPLGNVALLPLGSLLQGSLPGSWNDSQLREKIPDQILRPLLAGLLFLIGTQFVI